MPIYEYKCEKCGVFEYQQSITAEPLTECPECKGSVKKLISSNVNIIFKGSGWHINDYRSPSYKKDAQADSANHTCPAGGSCSAEGTCKAASGSED